MSVASAAVLLAGLIAYWATWRLRPDPCMWPVPRGELVRGSVGSAMIGDNVYQLGYLGTRDRSGESCVGWETVSESIYEREMLALYPLAGGADD